MSKLPQDVEEFIIEKQFNVICARIRNKDGVYAIDCDDLLAWMSGHARVPVETMQRLLQSVRDALEQAYNEAYPVCCGRAGHECCGSPDPELPPHAMATIEALDPIEKELSSMLNASKGE